MKTKHLPTVLFLLALALLPSCKPKRATVTEVPAPTATPVVSPMAENQAFPSPQAQDGGSNRGNFQQRTQQRLNEMTTAIDLTQDQADKVKTIMQDQFGALRGQTQGMSREDRRAAFQKARDAADAQIEQLLTPDQKPKWVEYQKQMEARRAQRAAQGGWGGGR